MSLSRGVRGALFALLAGAPVPSAYARIIDVPAQSGAAATALERAGDGDTLWLGAGIHRGPLQVKRSIVILGAPGAVVDGNRQGSPIEIFASGVVVENLEVRRSGRNVMRVDSGVKVISAERVILRRLRVEDVLYGISGERANRLSIERCRLSGRVMPRDETGEGNGIHLWYCDSVRVSGCLVDHFLDAIYLSFTGRTRIEGNTLTECGRYGLHTMYCQQNQLIGNHFTHNVAGCAIMFSNHLEVEGNAFQHNRGSRTYGLLLRDCSDGRFTHNRIVDNTVAVFMDNSNRNRFQMNLVEDNGWGVLLFSSCAGNEFTANNFVQNDYPVALDMRHTSNRFDDGVSGNYWSENPSYDLDGDGVSDVPYSPVTVFAFVSKQYPDLTVLAKSPAVAALGVAERVFPSLRPSEAVDRFPRVAPTPMTAAPASGSTPLRPPPAWAALFGFAAFSGFGMAALGRSKRRT